MHECVFSYPLRHTIHVFYLPLLGCLLCCLALLEEGRAAKAGNCVLMPPMIQLFLLYWLRSAR